MRGEWFFKKKCMRGGGSFTEYCNKFGIFDCAFNKRVKLCLFYVLI